MEVEFLGISFRNDNHLDWFIMTQCILWFVISVTAAFEYFYKEPWFMLTLLLLLGMIFGGISYAAYVLTDGGTKVVNEHLSPDCYWYNAILAVVYAVLVGIVLYLKRRRTTKRTAVT